MYIVPILTSEAVRGAAFTAWEKDSVPLVHLCLQKEDLADAATLTARLRETGAAVQLELPPVSFSEAAACLETCAGAAERIFLPLEVLAAPAAFLGLVAQFGSFVGVSIRAEEGCVCLPAPFPPEAVKPVEAARMFETSGVMSILYRDDAAEYLPIGQMAEVAMATDVNLFAAGRLESPAAFADLRAMKLMGWLCPPETLEETRRAVENAG